MANPFNIRRVAFGNWVFPDNTSDNTASTLSASAGVSIPKGAIVSGIRLYPAGALTNMSNMKNGTVNAKVGGQALGTSNVIMSNVVAETAVGQIGLADTDGVFVVSGGDLEIHIASSDSARTGIEADSDVYVDYIYCAERDTA